MSPDSIPVDGPGFAFGSESSHSLGRIEPADELEKRGRAKMEKRMRLDKGQIEVLDDAVAEILRLKTPGERLKIAFDMWESVRKMLMNHLAKSHPEWDESTICREVARRMSHGAV